MKIVECVPNFSEGRDQAVLDAIAAAIRAVDGASLLDVDPGAATNRTVFTIVGDPDAVAEAAFQATKRASELIDMRKHSGEHARMGATDVCPFVPVAGVTMEECAELARRVGKRAGEELGIPIYLYEHAASTPERRNLATIRHGEYEGLEAKLTDPRWKPDFGPSTHNPRAGATAVGAREFLIAYNVNLNTANKKLAHDIALDVREQGRFKRDENGKFVRNAEGKKVRQAGRFKHVKGVGWFIEEYGRAQISMNLTNHTVSPVHEVFDAIEELAHRKGLRVTGSEIVGLIPLEAMLEAGRHYLRKQGESTGVPAERLVEVAIQSLGLSEITPFDPDEKIIEHRIRGEARLASMDLGEFTRELASDSPAPGGGSVAALSGALSASLSAMVAHLTYGKKGFEAKRERMNGIAEKGHAHRAFFVDAVDRDTEAFDGIIAARRLPKKSDEEIAARDAAILEANHEATRVPLRVLERTLPTLELAMEVARDGNPNSLSDAGVAGLTALACAEGAYYNVLINLAGEEDRAFLDETRKAADRALERARELAGEVQQYTLERLQNPDHEG